MRITIVTVGSRGDVEPYIALGMGLQRAGHRVNIATHANFQPVIQSRGLGFSLLEGNPRAVLESDRGQAWLRSGSNPFSFLGRLSEIMLPMIFRMLEDALQACRDADIVIPSILGGLATYHVVEKLGGRTLPAFLQPASPTWEFASPSFPPRPYLGGIYNRLTYPMSEKMLWTLMKRPLNKARQEALGLPPLSEAWFSNRRSREFPILYGYSPHVVPKPDDWPEWLHVTGYWFLDPAGDWEPPAGLVDFLASGRPPVCVGFSSMKDREQQEITDTVLRALKITGQRGILVTGWGGLAQSDLSDDVFRIEEVPFSWLYPQTAAVVHHGGAGTTAAGIRAGVPAVVVPFFGDQVFWADRVHRLGIGPRPIPRKRLSAERLAAAITAAVQDEAIRQRASALGEMVRNEDGVGRAVRQLEELVANRSELLSVRPLL